MSKIELKNIANGFNLSRINDNFEKIETALNNKVLYRDNPKGEPNQMKQSLDMDGKDIINVRRLNITESIAIDGIDLATEVAKAEQSAALAAALLTTAEDTLETANEALGIAESIIDGVGEDQGSDLIGFKVEGGVRRSVADKLKDVINVKDFGAVGDGVTDDTASIIAALSAIAGQGGGKLSLGSGVFKFTTKLEIPANVFHGITIEGVDRFTSVLLYAGESTTTDLIEVSGASLTPDSEVTGGVTFRSLMIQSLTDMTAGSAIKVYRASLCNYFDISIGRQHEVRRLWDGFTFDCTDMQIVNGFELGVKNAGFKIGGEGVGSLKPQWDVWVSNGKVSDSVIGVHLAGGFDNVYFDQCMLTYNKTNVLIDTSMYDKPMQNVTFGASCVIEHAQDGGDGVLINSTAVSHSSTHIVLLGHIQSNSGCGVKVLNLPNGSIEILSPHISMNGLHGILIADNSITLSLSQATQISNNGGYGVHVAFAALNLQLPFVMKNNVSGAYNDNLHPHWNFKGIVNTSISDIPALGDTITNAAAIASDYTNVHPTGGGQGVRLEGAVGALRAMFNISGANAVNVYPHVGGQIGPNAMNTPVSLPIGGTMVFMRVNASVWQIVSNFAP